MKKNKNYALIFEDDDILVINKSAGVAVVPEKNQEFISLSEMLSRDFDNIMRVHRLDKMTSGLIVFAKNPEAHRALSLQFQNRTIDKLYAAIISGTVQSDSFEIDKKLLISNNSNKVIVSARGKDAISVVNLLEKTQAFSLVEVKILTGRKHQIRVHLTAIGHPIIGDELYNSSPEIFLSKYKKKYNLAKGKEERPIIARTALHAHKITFDHPKSGEPVSFTAPYPKDFQVAWKLMKQYT